MASHQGPHCPEAPEGGYGHYITLHQGLCPSLSSMLRQIHASLVGELRSHMLSGKAKH